MAITVFILGYLIKYKGFSFLIAGYNTSKKEEKNKYDEKALCNGIGNLMFLLAISNLISGLGEILSIRWIVTSGWIIFVIIIIIGLIYINTNDRYMKK